MSTHSWNNTTPHSAHHTPRSSPMSPTLHSPSMHSVSWKRPRPARRLRFWSPGRICAGLVLVAVLQFSIIAPFIGPFFGHCSSRSAMPVSSGVRTTRPEGQIAGIVVTVHGALDYLAACLDSWQRTTVESYMYIVDDCDGDEETAQLSALCRTYPNLTLIVKEGHTHVGYTKAINAGFRAAYADGFRYILQLNSDTVLTPNWLPPLIAVLERNASVGAVGPLSNAATWQSVPYLTNELGKWSLNPMPPNWNQDMMAKLAFLLSDNRPVELPILGGFLIAYRREIFHTVGYMDDVLSPVGFGEENDFAFRTRRHGFALVLLPTTYVLHHKGKSFSAEERAMLTAETDERMRQRYGVELADAVKSFKSNDKLKEIRARFQRHFTASLPALLHDVSALFILNVMSTKTKFMLHGGWISLVQEALGLWQNGFYVRVAVPMHLMSDFNRAFPAANAAGIFLGFAGMTPEAVAGELIAGGTVFDFAIATHYSTAPTVMALCDQWPNAVPSYYVQDIETKFGGANEVALQSYTVLSRGFMFVKTRWLQEQLQEQFNVESHLIPPTVDTNFFTPGKQNFKGPVQLCAMVRLSTPRRNPFETLQILTWAMKTFGREKMNATAFGSPNAEINAFLKQQNNTYVKMSLVNVLGALDRNGARRLNQQCEVFLDFSAWQAFGRSGIEAMACGAVPILPQLGGAAQYAEQGVNAFLIDTSNMTNAHNLLTEIAEGKYDLASMRKAALATAAKYSIAASSKATSAIFREFWGNWRTQRGQLIAHPR